VYSCGDTTEDVEDGEEVEDVTVAMGRQAVEGYE